MIDPQRKELHATTLEAIPRPLRIEAEAMRRLDQQEARPLWLQAVARVHPRRLLLRGETAVLDEETRVVVQRPAHLAANGQRRLRVELAAELLLQAIVHQVLAGLAVQSSNEDGDVNERVYANAHGYIDLNPFVYTKSRRSSTSWWPQARAPDPPRSLRAGRAGPAGPCGSSRAGRASLPSQCHSRCHSIHRSRGQSCRPPAPD